MRHTIVRFVSIASAVALAALAGACTKQPLKKLERSLSTQDPGLSESRESFLLPPPGDKKGIYRVMIFVDQSYSMVRHKCATDLDGPDADVNGPICANQEKGNDFDGHRFAAINEWIEQLRFFEDQSDPNRVKVAIRPFSGGATKREIPKQDDPADFVFRSLSDSENWLSRLKQEHEFAKGSDSGKLGTTTPLSQFQGAIETVSKEMDTLKAQGLLGSAHFKFVYLTDGVFKPLDKLLNRALTLMGCKCPGGADSVCNRDPSVPWGDYGTDPKIYCEAIFPNEFKKAFGDPAENTVERMAEAFIKLTDLPAIKKGGTLDVHVVKIHPEATPADDRSAPENMFDSIFVPLKARIDAGQIAVHVLSSASAPFPIRSGAGVSSTYRIRDFVAINLNAWVDVSGKLVVDSDGDGLSDADEIRLGYDPHNPRSKNACLDGVDAIFGCSNFACDPAVDLDGDGLNECEELAVKTNFQRTDHDGDGIFDRFEALRGLDATQNDNNRFTAGDQWTDHVHFLMGVDPHIPLASVPESDRVGVSVNFIEETPRGPLYDVKIAYIPTVNTMASNGEGTVYLSREGNRRIPDAMSMHATPHAAGQNQVIVLIKAQSMEDPQDYYWLVNRVNLDHSPTGVVRGFQLDMRNFISLDTYL